jgi:transcriptional regulator with XRE-family HTH domain
MADCDDDAGGSSLDAPTVELDEGSTLRTALVALCRRGRALRGWTVEELAAAAGVDRKTVDRVVNGHRTPLDTVERILRALGLEGDVVEGLEDVATDPDLDP